MKNIFFLFVILTIVTSYSVVASLIDDDLCDEQIFAITEAAEAKEFWVFQLLDSWGKIDAGVFVGSKLNYGRYWECLNFTHETKEAGLIEGRYCLVTWSLPPEISIKEIDKNTSVVFSNGICLPASCSPTKALDYLNTLLASKNFTLYEAKCSTKHALPLDSVDIAAISILSVFGVLILISTTYDVLARRDKTKKPNKLLIAFSLYTNGGKLFKVTEDKTGSTIDCLEGLRSISMLCVILGHRFLMHYAGIANILEFVQFHKSYKVLFFVWEYLCVDTFLTIGGFLAALQILLSLERKNYNPIKLIIHRYIRYTPVLVAATLCFLSIFRHIKAPNPGALRYNVTEDCHNNWWSMLLHIQNYANPNHQCAPHSWYLSVDFQLFVISTLLIYPAFKYGWKFLWTLPAMAIAGTAFVIKICLDNDFMYNALVVTPLFEKTLYFPTHARFAPWLIGMVLGYVIFKTKGKEVKMNKLARMLLWTLSITVMGFLVACFFPFAQFEDNDTTFKENAVFLAGQRLIWPIPLCWIIFACYKLNSGGFIRWLLSLPEWQPVGRLSLSMYVTHIFYLLLETSYAKDPRTFEFSAVMSTYLCDVMAVIVISVFFCLTIEMPICAVERLFWPKSRKSKPSELPQQLIAEDTKPIGIDNPVFTKTEDERL